MIRNVIVALALVVMAFAQAKPAHSAKAKAALPAKSATASAATTSKLPTEEEVNTFLYQTFGYNPTLSWKVNEIRPTQIGGLIEVVVVLSDQQGSNSQKFYVTADGKHAVTGEIIPFGPAPFEEDRLKLEKGVNGLTRGPEKAAVTIVEFSDMQCPHCKQVAPIVEQVLAQEPDARFVFQNFPLPGHTWAEKAAGYVECIGRSSHDAVWPFIEKAFEEQTNITEANLDEKLKGIATGVGANADEAAACAVKPETKARIEASIALGKAVHVTGTPTIFVNGRPLSGNIPADVLKQIIDFAGSQQGDQQENAKQ